MKALAFSFSSGCFLSTPKAYSSSDSAMSITLTFWVLAASVVPLSSLPLLEEQAAKDAATNRTASTRAMTLLNFFIVLYLSFQKIAVQILINIRFIVVHFSTFPRKMQEIFIDYAHKYAVFA